jgi:hypothetical protein
LKSKLTVGHKPKLDTSGFRYCLIRSERDAARPEPFHGTWDEVVDLFSSEAERWRPRKGGPAFLPVVFGDAPNDKGNHRHDANVRLVSAVVFDLDGKVRCHTAADLRERLDGTAYLAHTTFSSTPERPRWRVILPLKRPVTPDEHTRVIRTAAGHFGFDRDTSCDNPSRLHYLPCNGARVLVGGGEWLDPVQLPDAAPPPSSERNSRGRRLNPVVPSLCGTTELTPPGTTRLSPRSSAQLTHSASLADVRERYGNRLVTLDEAVKLFNYRVVGLAIADRMGLEIAELEGGASKTKDFPSPLPWRVNEDQKPSAAYLMKPGHELVLHDCGAGGGTYSLAQLAMAFAYRKPHAKGTCGSLLLLWRIRLLVEAGVLEPAPVPELPPCPVDVTRAQQKVYDGFRLPMACKGRVKEWAGEPSVFAKEFVAAWCGVSAPTAHHARQALAEAGVLHICGKHRGRACLYKPGPHPRHPHAKARRAAEAKERRQNAMAGLRRIAAKLGVAVPDPLPDGFLERLAVKVLCDRRMGYSDPYEYGTIWKELDRADRRGRR